MMLLDMYGEPYEYEKRLQIKVGFHPPPKTQSNTCQETSGSQKQKERNTTEGKT